MFDFPVILKYLRDFFSPEFLFIVEITILYVVVVISPGPDFAITIRNSIYSNRLSAWFSAIGTSTGMFYWATMSSLFMYQFISRFPVVFDYLKIFGSAYLFYLTYQSIKGAITSYKRKGSNLEDNKILLKQSFTPWQTFKSAFLTNALNPLVLCFFIGMLPGLVQQCHTSFLKFFCLYEIVILGFVWFTFVSLVFSNTRLRILFLSKMYIIETLAGITFVYFAFKVLNAPNACIAS